MYNLFAIIGSSVGSAAIVSIFAFLVNNYLIEKLKGDIQKNNDILVSKLENELSKDNFKHERAHLKRIEIIEKLNKDINTLHSDMVYFFNIKKENSIDGKKGHNEIYSEITTNIRLLQGYLGFCKLYLPNQLLSKISELICGYAFYSLIYFAWVTNKKDRNPEEDNSKYLNKWENSLAEITELSKKIINEKDFECEK